MKKILIFLIRIFGRIQRLKRKLTRKSEQDIYNQRIVSGKAWEEFCENLKAAGTALMYPGSPHDPFQQAEGVRYLSRLTRAGLEAFVEYGDPAFPVFRRMVHETVKLGADNPDNHYLNAQISGKYEYRITGNRNTIHYFGFFTQNGNYGSTGGLAPCDVLEHFDIDFEDDGSFEVILSKEKKSKNWLKIEDETSLVMVRQTFFNRFNEIPISVKIENLDGRTSPDPVTPEKIDEGLKTASLFVAGAPLLFAKWAKGFQKHTNQLPLFDSGTSNAAGGDANIIYHHSHWKLEDDEVLEIKVKPPDCDSWNFQLNNYWMESLDYRYHNVCINKSNAHYEDDGKVVLYVSHKNTGRPNWIETCGHHEGTMCWRWYRLKDGHKPVVPVCIVKKYSEIASL